MKNIITVIVLWLLMPLLSNAQTLNELANISGVEFTAEEMTNINAAIVDLFEVLPDDVKSNFEVFDYGYYIYSDFMNGRMAAAWDKAKIEAIQESKNYILFGREYLNTGEENIIWVDIQLPSDQYGCATEEKIEMLNGYIAARIHSSEAESTAERIVEGIKLCKKEFDIIFNCCTSRNSCESEISIEEAVLNLTVKKVYGNKRYVQLENISNLQLYNHTETSPQFDTNKNNQGYKFDYTWVDPQGNTIIETVDLSHDLSLLLGSIDDASVSIMHFNLATLEFIGDTPAPEFLKGPLTRGDEHTSSSYYEDIIILEEDGKFEILFRLGDEMTIDESQYREHSTNDRFLFPVAAYIMKKLAMAGGSIVLNLVMESGVTYFISTFGEDVCTFPEAFSQILGEKNIWSYIIWGLEGAFAEFTGATAIAGAVSSLTSAILQYILNPPGGEFTVSGLTTTILFGVGISLVTVVAGKYIGKIFDGINNVLVGPTYGFVNAQLNGFFADLVDVNFLLHLFKAAQEGCGTLSGTVKSWNVLPSYIRKTKEWLDYVQDAVSSHSLTYKQAGLSAKAVNNTPNGWVTQNISDFDQLYVDAAVAKTELDNIVTSITSQFGGKPSPRPGLKDPIRAKEKIDLDPDPNANYSWLTDIAASRIIFDKLDDFYHVLDNVVVNFDIQRLGDRVVNPLPTGFRDVILNLKMSNGHMVELQISLKEMIEESDRIGHIWYEELRTLNGIIQTQQGGVATSEQTIIIEGLINQMKSLYDSAYQKILNRQ